MPTSAVHTSGCDAPAPCHCSSVAERRSAPDECFSTPTSVAGTVKCRGASSSSACVATEEWGGSITTVATMDTWYCESGLKFMGVQTCGSGILVQAPVFVIGLEFG